MGAICIASAHTRAVHPQAPELHVAPRSQQSNPRGIVSDPADTWPQVSRQHPDAFLVASLLLRAGHVQRRHHRSAAQGRRRAWPGGLQNPAAVITGLRPRHRLAPVLRHQPRGRCWHADGAWAGGLFPLQGGQRRPPPGALQHRRLHGVVPRNMRQHSQVQPPRSSALPVLHRDRCRRHSEAGGRPPQGRHLAREHTASHKAFEAPGSGRASPPVAALALKFA